MNAQPAVGLLQFLQRIPDPRGRNGQRHSHTAMLAVVVAAMLCNFQSFVAIEQWIRTLPIEWWHRLGGKRRPPCANSFCSLLNAVDPMALQDALLWWVTDGLGLKLSEEQISGIIIDGKTLRGTRSDHQRTRQILAALDQETGCVLSETDVAADTNEARTALKLLETMMLKGRVIVGDAAFCQRDICEAIIKQGGDYLFVIKDNQPSLLREAQQSFVIPEGFSPLATA